MMDDDEDEDDHDHNDGDHAAAAADDDDDDDEDEDEYEFLPFASHWLPPSHPTLPPTLDHPSTSFRSFPFHSSIGISATLSHHTHTMIWRQA